MAKQRERGRAKKWKRVMMGVVEPEERKTTAESVARSARRWKSSRRSEEERQRGLGRRAAEERSVEEGAACLVCARWTAWTLARVGGRALGWTLGGATPCRCASRRSVCRAWDARMTRTAGQRRCAETEVGSGSACRDVPGRGQCARRSWSGLCVWLPRMWAEKKVSGCVHRKTGAGAARRRSGAS